MTRNSLIYRANGNVRQHAVEAIYIKCFILLDYGVHLSLVFGVIERLSRFTASLQIVLTYPCAAQLAVQDLGLHPILDNQVIHKAMQNSF